MSVPSSWCRSALEELAIRKEDQKIHRYPDQIQRGSHVLRCMALISPFPYLWYLCLGVLSREIRWLCSSFLVQVLAALPLKLPTILPNTLLNVVRSLAVCCFSFDGSSAVKQSSSLDDEAAKEELVVVVAVAGGGEWWRWRLLMELDEDNLLVDAVMCDFDRLMGWIDSMLSLPGYW